MLIRGHHLIAREAWPLLVLLVAATVLGSASAGFPLDAILGSATIAVMLLARNPRRAVPSVPLGIVSPVDGVVREAGAGHDPWLARPAAVFRIRMRFWNVHALRSPVEGKVMERWSRAGRFPWQRRHAWWIRTDEGDNIVLALDLGLAAPLVRLGLQSGERIGQGQICGFIYLASTVAVFAHSGSRIGKHPGDPVISGSDVIAEFVHAPGKAPAAAE